MNNLTITCLGIGCAGLLSSCASQKLPAEIAKTAHEHLTANVREIDAKSVAETQFYDDTIRLTRHSYRMRREDDLIERTEFYPASFMQEHPDGEGVTAEKVKVHMETAITDWAKRDEEIEKERLKSETELLTGRQSVELARDEVNVLKAKLASLSKPPKKNRIVQIFEKLTKKGEGGLKKKKKESFQGAKRKR